ncbi:MAG: putative protease, partial [Verrucomicrobiaceae bacterium]|nr:putative protease [Verrucomicrobiaceae bacterium]
MKLALLLPLALASLAFAESPQGYYRRPALHGDTIVFVSEGDLWRVSAAGGVAQRLTTHPGAEIYPAISPDGKTIAFIGQYEGLSEVYTMPLEGGLPTRQTFEGGAPKVTGWTPDGKVLYSTEKYSTLPNVQLLTLDPVTHVKKILPLAQATDGTYDPATGTLFFVRLPKQGSATKRYHGGWAENLWRFKEGDAEATPLTAKDTGTNREPLWWQGRVYFTSDRDGVMNIWSMKPDGTDVKQHTHHKDMDVKGPSLDAGRIAYQLGADVWLHDIASGKEAVVKIALASDFDQEREHWIKKPMEYLTSAHLSPSGDKLVLTTRGEVFIAPVDTGRMVELPRKTDVRYRNAVFLPDGKNVVVQSDESGESEFWKMQANGLGANQRLSTDGKVFRFAHHPSPDGKWLAWADKLQKLWVMNVATKETKIVRESTTDEISDFSWSPDSQWLAFVEEGTNTYAQIKLYRLSDGSTTVATSDRFNSHNPAWSPDGKFLYFLSERELHTLVTSPWGARQPEPYFGESTKIYQLALQKGTRSPFKAKDELTPEPPIAKATPGTRDDLVERITQAVLAKLPKPEKKPEDPPKPLPPPPTKPPPGSSDNPPPIPAKTVAPEATKAAEPVAPAPPKP